MGTVVVTVLLIGVSVLIPVLVIVRMLRRAKGPGWAKAPGALDGRGTIVEVRDTGTTMNEAALFAFTLDVALPGEQPYRAVTKMLIGRTNFGVLQPGMVVAVKVKPDDHDEVWIDLAQPIDASGGAGAIAAGFGSGAQAPAEVGSAAELLATGTYGTATIRAAQPLGKTVGDLVADPAPGTADDPLYLFEVEIALDGGADPFPARFGHRVPKDRITTLAEGSRLRVAVDPSRPSTEVAIDWS